MAQKWLNTVVWKGTGIYHTIFLREQQMRERNRDPIWTGAVGTPGTASSSQVTGEGSAESGLKHSGNRPHNDRVVLNPKGRVILEGRCIKPDRTPANQNEQ